MSKRMFELNTKGIRRLFYSNEMKEALTKTAQEIAPNATDYEVENMPTRAIVIVKSERAWNDNTENNTLLKRMK